MKKGAQPTQGSNANENQGILDEGPFKDPHEYFIFQHMKAEEKQKLKELDPNEEFKNGSQRKPLMRQHSLEDLVPIQDEDTPEGHPSVNERQTKLANSMDDIQKLYSMPECTLCGGPIGLDSQKKNRKTC